jgi:hypothetical protein
MLKIRSSIGVVLAFFVGLMTAAILSGGQAPMAIAQDATKPSLAPRFQVDPIPDSFSPFGIHG